MKTIAVCMAVLASLLLVLYPSAIQGKDAGRVGGEPAPMSAGSGMGPMPSGGGSISMSGAESMGGGASSGSISPGALGGYYSDGSSNMIVPNQVLQQTSFGTATNYYNWTSYYSHLVTSYDMAPSYFGRFYRNREPLITPEIMKRTLAEPLRLSQEILDSIDQIEELVLQDSASRPESDRAALINKSRRIRELAKRIRNNETLTTVDLRKEEKLYDVDPRASLDPEAVERMREMAVDLDRQLRNMYSSSTSTVSVESYKEHSLESLAKGIEKVCKSIEYSARRM